MDEPTAALARAVVDAKKWTWLAGMLTTRYGRVKSWVTVDLFTGAQDSVLTVFDEFDDDGDIPVPSDAIPDLTDPLTAAGALMVFRAAYADDGAYVARDGDEWVAWAEIDGPDNGRDGVGHGPTELEATIAAILAAPLKESPDAPLR